MMLALFTTSICIRMLAFNYSIQKSIIHFVALEMITELPALYFESLIENKAMNVMHHMPPNKWKGKDKKWEDRTLFHKFARVLYVFLRSFYVSCIFYFLPFSAILL